MSAIATLGALIIAYPIAYYIVRSTNERLVTSVIVLTFLTFFVGGVIRNYSWLVLFLDTGPIVQLAYLFGARDIKLLGTEIGVTLSLTHSLVPYAVLALTPSLKNVDRSTEEAALSLGANEIKTFLRVTLPLSVPGIIAATSLSFALAVSAFVTPLIIGQGIVNMLSNFIYVRFMELFDYGFGSVVSVVLLVITLFIAYVVNGFLIKKVEGLR
jgi:putative spermidine/putrescine transport system permease protein